MPEAIGGMMQLATITLVAAAIVAQAARFAVGMFASFGLGFTRGIAIVAASLATGTTMYLIADPGFLDSSRDYDASASVLALAAFCLMLAGLLSIQVRDAAGSRLGFSRALIASLLAVPLALVGIAAGLWLYLKFIACGLLGQCI